MTSDQQPTPSVEEYEGVIDTDGYEWSLPISALAAVRAPLEARIAELEDGKVNDMVMRDALLSRAEAAEKVVEALRRIATGADMGGDVMGASWAELRTVKAAHAALAEYDALVKPSGTSTAG